MGIRKKIFYITAAAMLSILLVSYGIMYLFFIMSCLRKPWSDSGPVWN